MASVSPHQADQPVFCQHLLKPIEHQPGAYRCVHCGQVGDMRDRKIIWREQNPGVAAPDRGRAGGVSPEAVLGILIAASVLVCTFVWCCQAMAGPAELQPVAAAVELQPIPREAAAEQDSGCCGGGPQSIPMCTVCFTYDIAGLGEFTVCDTVECRGRFNVCRLKALFRLANGHYLIQAECVDIRNINRREIERII